MNRRRFLNLVVQNWADGVYSLRRIDPYKHLFYRSRGEAEAADLGSNKNGVKILERLPVPISSFSTPPVNPLIDGCLNLFALLAPHRSESRILHANKAGEPVLYDSDKRLWLTLPRLNEPKGIDPLCFSINPPGGVDDSLYVMCRCPADGPRFEVLEFRLSTRTYRDYIPDCLEGFWCWRILPPPPCVYQPGHVPSVITSHTTMSNADGCTAICISSARFGTYCFDTVPIVDYSRPERLVHLEKWRHVGDWALPFDGRAHYIPDFNLWFGFSDSSPNHLCAVDLSAMEHGRIPTVQHVWQYLNPPEEDDWQPLFLSLVYLGDGRFCIVNSFEAEANGRLFAVLTGVEIVRDGERLRMVKHKCKLYWHTRDEIRSVL